MIDSLYDKYFQKSRSFLYPLLGIKKNSPFVPLGTYIAVKDAIDPDEMKLICTYSADESPEFVVFENDALISNPLFHNVLKTKDVYIYVFDLKIYQNDWFNFIMGKYSLMTPIAKKAIKIYYGANSDEYEYLDSYLNPSSYYEVYANILGMSAKELKNAGELCDP